MNGPDAVPGARHLAVVGMGSNLGGRRRNLRGALLELAQEPGHRVHVCSSLYETEPFGNIDQPWFLNCVVQINTAHGLKPFFRTLQRTESLFGRTREERWGPRTLDLDLLFFDDMVYSDEELNVPHPGVAQRRFVLAPLCEVAPDLIHPAIGKSIRDLLDGLNDNARVVKLGEAPLWP